MLTAFFLYLLVVGCKGKMQQAKYSSPEGYDLSKPIMLNLRTELDEISGIVHYGKDTSLFAINDEMGVLYKIYLRTPLLIEKWKFSGGADFEDISLLDSTFYVLQSHGDITRFRIVTADSIVVDACGTPLSEKNEFETMYYDKFHGKFILICKDCKQDNKSSVTAFAFDPLTKTFNSSPFFVMDAKPILTQLGDEKNKFKPSAAAINPVTKDLYIVSAVNNALVVATRDGKVKEVYKLNSKLFKQPEGLSFNDRGDLYISNESAEIGAGNILIFKYKPELNETH
ncbi:MAG: hypothetical protein JWQ96_1338 [Segetibacter sp.]|nr:hypothetical protein [Segetibacter sp.]